MSVPTLRSTVVTACVVTALVGLGACSDDGSEVREIESDCASASGSAASGSAAGGSASSTEASGSAASGSASAECEPVTEESSSP